MNIKKGMRRLALFVGVVGATMGGVVAYGDLVQVVAQRAQYKEFERSAAQVITFKLKDAKPVASGAIDISAGLVPIKPSAKDSSGLWTKYAQPVEPSPKDSSGPPPGVTLTPIPPPPPGYKLDTPLMSPEQFAAKIKAKYPEYQNIPDDELARKVIAKYPVYGQQVFQHAEDGVPAKPTLWAYILVAIYPILGFFIPWGTVRGVEWVRAGFFDSSN